MYDLWKVIFLILLCIYGSVYDIRTRQIPKFFVVTVFLASAVFTIWGIPDDYSFWWMMIGMIPGLVWLAFSRISKDKMGEGDGLLLMGLGMGLGIERISLVLVAALFLNALAAGILLAVKKADGKTRIPFVPFITAGLVMLLVNIIGII